IHAPGFVSLIPAYPIPSYGACHLFPASNVDFLETPATVLELIDCHSCYSRNESNCQSPSRCKLQAVDDADSGTKENGWDVSLYKSGLRLAVL
ncbi:MAG: hypothetical protein ACPGED_12100, partial [Flavobacteriales bacterium]